MSAIPINPSTSYSPKKAAVLFQKLYVLFDMGTDGMEKIKIKIYNPTHEVSLTPGGTRRASIQDYLNHAI